jgi:TolB-like protein/Tfp pilus assembly protein PilF/predicted Ser/Thr protein kinase
MIGHAIGRYTITGKLGQGGMGIVYLARDSELDRIVALKILPPDVSGDSDRIRRFVQEAKIASSLNHPNVAHIYDIGEAIVNGQPVRFIAMEYVEGRPLSSLTAGTSASTAMVIEAGTQIADALDHAHRRGITHRDIKPSNVLFTPGDQIKVLDFGLAKVTRDPAAGDETEAMTQAGTVLGTLSYMSPEQALGRDVDARTDIFSLGIVLYELAAGRSPFAGATPADSVDRLLNSAPAPASQTNPHVPPELDRIIRKCLEKDRERRYQSAKELLVDLRNLRRDSDPAAYKANAAESRSYRRWMVLAGLLAALALAGAFVGPPLYQRMKPAAAIESVAVLPFYNAAGDADTDYVSDGITETLTNNLARLPDLRVVPRTLAARFAGRDIDVRKAARELNVRAVLTGRVAQRAGTLRIQTELIDAGTEAHIWGAQYERKPSEILALQEEMANQVAMKLRSNLPRSVRDQVARSGTQDSEAYQLYIKGDYYFRKLTRTDVQRGIDHFRRAIDKDPLYANAYAGLADAYFSQVVFLAAPPREVMPRVKQAAARALELDPSLAKAHWLMAGVLLHYDWDWNASRDANQRALALGPDEADTNFSWGLYLCVMGRLDEARAAFARARDLNPLSPENVSILGDPAVSANFEVGMQANRSALELQTDFYPAIIRMAQLLAFQGRYDDALRELQRALQIEDTTWARSWQAFALARSGKKAEAIAVVNELRRLQSKQYVPAHQLAIAYVGLGDRIQALESLERMYEERSLEMPFLNVDRVWQPVRSDPRFISLLRRLKL